MFFQDKFSRQKLSGSSVVDGRRAVCPRRGINMVEVDQDHGVPPRRVDAGIMIPQQRDAAVLPDGQGGRDESGRDTVGRFFHRRRHRRRRRRRFSHRRRRRRGLMEHQQGSKKQRLSRLLTLRGILTLPGMVWRRGRSRLLSRHQPHCQLFLPISLPIARKSHYRRPRRHLRAGDYNMAIYEYHKIIFSNKNVLLIYRITRCWLTVSRPHVCPDDVDAVVCILSGKILCWLKGSSFR